MLNKIYDWAKSIRQKLSEKGQGMVEYALILAAVAIIAVVAIWGTSGDGGEGTLKGAVTGSFTKATEAVDKANDAVDKAKAGNAQQQTGNT